VSQAPVLAEHYQGKDRLFAEATTELNRRVDAGTSWSGNERNNLFLNLGSPKGDEQIPDFADVSAVAGFDFPDDSRALVSIDWDFDGDLDFITSNRTAPRVRIFENNASQRQNSSLAIKLVGVEMNRDAIGSRVEIEITDESGETIKMQRTLHGGQGFISQSSRWLHFGIPEGFQVAKARVYWNGSEPEEIGGISGGKRWLIYQGGGSAHLWTLPQIGIPKRGIEPEPDGETSSTSIAHLARPIPLPAIPYTDASGSTQLIKPGRDRPLILNLWATWCLPCVAELKEFSALEQELRTAGADVLALCVDVDPDDPDAAAKAAKILKDTGFPFTSGFATTETLELIHSAHNSAFLRPSQIPVPTTLIIAPGLRIASVIRGAIDPRELLPALEALGGGADQWENFSSPTSTGGTWVYGPDTVYYANIAKQMIEREQFSEAASFLMGQRQWLKAEGKKYAEMLMLVGTKLLEQGERQSGTDLLQAAVEEQPDLPAARNNLAVALLQSDRGDEAATHLQAAIKADPDAVDAKVNLARYLVTDQSYEKALRLASEVMKKGYNPGAIRVRAQVYAARGDTFDLHNTFAEMVEHEPDNPTVWVNFGKLQLSTGDRESALASFEKALSISPDSPDLRNLIHSLKDSAK